MKWREFKKEIDEIMISHENDNIHNIIVFINNREKFKLEKNKNGWIIRNEPVTGIII